LADTVRNGGPVGYLEVGSKEDSDVGSVREGVPGEQGVRKPLPFEKLRIFEKARRSPGIASCV